MELVIHQVKFGLPAYNDLYTELLNNSGDQPTGEDRDSSARDIAARDDSVAREATWHSLHINLISTLGLHCSTAPMRVGEDAPLDHIDVAVVQAIVNYVLPNAGAAPPAIRSHLIAELDRGVQDGGDETYSHECLASLFVMCKDVLLPEREHSCRLVVAREAAELLVTRCAVLIIGYVRDLKLSGHCIVRFQGALTLTQPQPQP